MYHIAPTLVATVMNNISLLQARLVHPCNPSYYINTCCYNRMTLFANISYIRETIWCRPPVLSTLCRQILLSEIAQIAASLGCKTHIYNFWEGWRNYKEGKGEGDFCARVYGKVTLI